MHHRFVSRFVVDRNNHRFQIYSLTTGDPACKATIGETGVPSSDNAHFNYPEHIAVDSSDRIYIVDEGNGLQTHDERGIASVFVRLWMLQDGKYGPYPEFKPPAVFLNPYEGEQDIGTEKTPPGEKFSKANIIGVEGGRQQDTFRLAGHYVAP